MKLMELMKLQREQKEVKDELEEANMENQKVNNNTDIVKQKTETAKKKFLEIQEPLKKFKKE